MTLYLWGWAPYNYQLTGASILCPFMMQGYIRYRESGCVETLLQSEGLPDVLFSGVEGEHYS